MIVKIFKIDAGADADVDFNAEIVKIDIGADAHVDLDVDNDNDFGAGCMLMSISNCQDCQD